MVLEPEWLASRAPVIREAVLMAKLISFLFNGVPAADFPTFQDQIRELGTGHRHSRRPYHPRQVRNPERQPGQRHASVQRTSARCHEAEGEKPSDHAVMIASSRQHIEGMAAFLSGRNQEALEHFREALKLFRKATHKRKIFMPDIQGLLALALPAAGRRPEPDGRVGGLDRGRRARAPLTPVTSAFWRSWP